MNQATRFPYLDAIRGLAALSVLIFHVVGSRWGEYKWTLWFFNGGAAVAMFFVISGFVLSHKFLENAADLTPNGYKKFIIARIFRIYPAFWFMILVYYMHAHWHELSFSFWIETIIHNPHAFWQEALLIRDHHDLFFPDWTLGLEIAISALVPFLAWLILRNEKLFKYLLIAIFILGDIYVTGSIILFGFGIYLAKYQSKIASFKDNTKWWYRYRWWLLPVVFFAFNLFRFFKISPIGSTVYYFIENFVFIQELLVSGIAAAVMLMYVINSPRIQRILSTKPFQILGQYSYGLYLSHWLIISFGQQFASEIKQYFGLNDDSFCLFGIFAAFFCAFLMAIFLYHFIEKPSIVFGKKWAAKISERP
jgi:peptidoglycan/LPS O-acetylase OafA/YrhL